MARSSFTVRFTNNIPKLRRETRRAAETAAELAADMTVEMAKDDLNNKSKHPHAVGPLRDSIKKEQGKWVGNVYSVSFGANKPYAWEEEMRGNGAHSYLLSSVFVVSPRFASSMARLSRKAIAESEIK